MTRYWLIEAVERAGFEPATSTSDLEEASTSEAWGIVSERYGVPPDDLAVHVGNFFELPVADLHELEAGVLERIPEKFARRYEVIPLREEKGTLVVATCDPTDLGTEQSLAFAAGLPPRYEIAPPGAIREAIEAAYSGGQSGDHRISTVPTRESGNAVIRIHNPEPSMRFGDLGMPGHQRDRFRELLSCRDGFMIVTGPKGSGKTTTLYAGISEIATGNVNVLTIEDPVECELPGVTQIQVGPERDATFASALRAILRQDPDVILVGEIPDPETAEVVVQASSTGHLVLATLHTHSAVGSLSRLAELGLDPIAIESSLRGAIAQRLVRKACTHCAKELGEDDALTPEEEHLVKRYGIRPKVRAIGCARCTDIGYRGQIPVAEVLLMDYQMADLVSRGVPGSELERAATASGMRTILECAIERVKAGETTLQEVARVLGQSSEGLRERSGSAGEVYRAG